MRSASSLVFDHAYIAGPLVHTLCMLLAVFNVTAAFRGHLCRCCAFSLLLDPGWNASNKLRDKYIAFSRLKKKKMSLKKCGSRFVYPWVAGNGLPATSYTLLIVLIVHD